MPSFGRFDNREFEAFANEFQDKVKGKLIAQAVEDALAKTAETAINLVTNKTPEISGTLRRNWEASEGKSFGGIFVVNIYNNTEYAQFVEFGHRIPNGPYPVGDGKFAYGHGGFRKGQFMLRDTIKEIDRNWEQLVGKKFVKALTDILEG